MEHRCRRHCGSFRFRFFSRQSLGYRNLRAVSFPERPGGNPKSWEANMKQYGQWRKEDEQDD